MELTLFIIVGAVAVAAAAMMLISENAVYSALFLILNFACIAFLFLMLNAPFLAMVQVTVYAGAIMVLFLFVIMLLGAERVMPESRPRFRWLAPVAVILALALLIAASVAIIDGDIDVISPSQNPPYARAVNALGGMEAIDVYLDDIPVAQGLAFGQSTDFKAWNEGRYTVSLFEAGADPASDTPLAERIADVNKEEALSFVAVGRISMGRADLAIATQHTAYNDDKNAFQIVAINGLPDRPVVDVWDETDTRELLFDNLAYGEASEIGELDKGTRTIGVYPDGASSAPMFALKDQEFDANTSTLLIFLQERREGNMFANTIINLKTDANPTFGSPTHIGRLLFTRYALPFEMVGLLLLVAMVGAIVLTHEAPAGRPRLARRLANPPIGFEQPVSREGK